MLIPNANAPTVQNCLLPIAIQANKEGRRYKMNGVDLSVIVHARMDLVPITVLGANVFSRLMA